MPRLVGDTLIKKKNFLEIHGPVWGTSIKKNSLKLLKKVSSKQYKIFPWNCEKFPGNYKKNFLEIIKKKIPSNYKKNFLQTTKKKFSEL